MKRILLFICALLTSCLSMMAQGSLTVTGKVIDGTNNEPLIGVNVSIKNEPGLGTITDINGKYIIKNVKPYSILVFTYVRFATE